MKGIILTGDRPTGPLHLGHYVGSLENRVKLQHEYEQYILIADAQALTDYSGTPEVVRNNIKEVLLDYLSVGIDPNLSTIFIQSQVPELFELTNYFLNLVTVSRLEQNPTVKEEIRQKAFSKSIPAGFLTYPVAQAADILAFNADIIPVGDDQNPMIEQTNEIVRKFNRVYKTNCFHEVKSFLGNTSRLPGLDGKSKMSKSLNNGIYLSDSEKIVSKKIKSMFTDPNHVKIDDPGTVEGNAVFTYLDAFSKNIKYVHELKAHYRKGGLGDGQVKKFLNQELEELLSPIRKKRHEFQKNPDYLDEILIKGTQKAREKASKTLFKVKKSMGLNYFY